MSKDYYLSNGTKIHVDDNGKVFNHTGYIGMVDQYGDFNAANGSAKYRINNYGEFFGSDGNSGKILNGNNITVNQQSNKSTNNIHESGGAIPFSLILKALRVILILGLLSTIIVGLIIVISLIKNGVAEAIPIFLIFAVAEIIAVSLALLLIKKL